MGKRSKSKKASTQRWGKGSKAVKPPQEKRNLQIELLWLLPALVLGFLVYANALRGDFVYDDELQILRNTLIQDGSQYWRALTSDVWKGFGGGDQTHSNYWRPSFVLWLILNFRCFGFELLGWHLASVFLHLAVITLAFVVLRRFAVSAPVAGAIVLLFAVHPVHCESVAWISGAPDLILGTALLGSLYFVHLLSKKKTPLRWALSIALYLVALGAKEIAILYPLIVVAVLYRGERDSGEKGVSWARTFSIAWPFVVVSVAYFIARQSILGFVQSSGSEASLSETVLTAPAVFAFYLRQMIVPYWIGPSYRLRVVTTANIGMANFIIPLVVTIVAGWWMIRMAGRSKIARIGLALLLIPLLLTLNIAVFPPEQLVHDRYLYVPLLGFLILTVPAIASLLQRAVSERMSRWPLLVFILAMIVSVPLAAQTVRYNRAWTSSLALWEWGVRSDPNSAYSYQLHGTSLYEAKRLEEAVAAFTRSIEIAPTASTYVVRATACIDQHKFAEAERDLRAVISQKKVEAYALYRAYLALAVCLENLGRTNEAIDAIKQGRIRLPHYTAALTGKLLSILSRAGRKNEALSELNAVRVQARTESLPESRLLLCGLGLLNVELGHPEEARAAFVEFLSVTQTMQTPGIKQARAEAEIALRNLDRQDPR